MLIPNKIMVMANDSFSIYDSRDNLECEIRRGDIFEAFLYEKTGEYFFVNQENGKEICVGCIDVNNCLDLDCVFNLYFNDKE